MNINIEFTRLLDMYDAKQLSREELIALVERSAIVNIPHIPLYERPYTHWPHQVVNPSYFDNHPWEITCRTQDDNSLGVRIMQ